MISLPSIALSAVGRQPSACQRREPNVAGATGSRMPEEEEEVAAGMLSAVGPRTDSANRIVGEIEV